MKKIISKIFACLAVCVFALGAVSLVACGEKENPAPKDNTVHVSTVQEFNNAITKDNIITLDGNIEGNDITFNIEHKITINLNGHNITRNITAENTAYQLFFVKGENAELTINGNGNVTVNGQKNNAKNGYIFYVGSLGSKAKGKLTINGGTYYIKSSATVAHVIYGEIIINGGSFENEYDQEDTVKTSGAEYLINRQNNDSGEVKTYANAGIEGFNYDRDVKITINGGKFKGYDPSNNKGATEDKADDELTGYLGAGKNSVAGNGNNGAESGWYIVQDKAAD